MSSDVLAIAQDFSKGMSHTTQATWHLNFLSAPAGYCFKEVSSPAGLWMALLS